MNWFQYMYLRLMYGKRNPVIFLIQLAGRKCFDYHAARTMAEYCTKEFTPVDLVGADFKVGGTE